MSYANALMHYKRVISKRDIREVAYEIDHAYRHGYDNMQFKHMIDSVFNSYDRFGSWTPRQEEFLRTHLAHIKVREYAS